MRLFPIAALALLASVSACIPAPAPVTRPAEPVPVPVPPPATPVVPASSDWRDWPLTPGDWRYARDAGGSVAVFGGGTLTLRCTPSRTITLSRPGTVPEAVTVRTNTSARNLTLQPTGAGQVAASLPAADPLVDAMGFSRGRFVIESAGRPPLVIPAWPEILRVAEDCRG